MRTPLQIFLVLVLAAVARFAPRPAPPLWTDEIATCWVATAPDWQGTVLRATATQGQSPFYYLLVRGVLKVLPPGEMSLRLFSGLASLASVALVFLLTDELFRNRRAALFAALLFALHDVQIYYALEARAYALGMFFVLLSQWCFLRWWRGGGRAAAAGCAVAGALGCWCNYFFLPLVLVQGLHFWLLRRCVSETGAAAAPAVSGGGAPPTPGAWLMMQALWLVLLLPLLGQAAGMLGGRAAWNWMVPAGPGVGWDNFAAMFMPRVLLVVAPTGLIMLLAERPPLATMLARHRAAMLLLAAWLLVPVFCVWGGSLLLGMSFMQERYLLLALLPAYPLAGAALALPRRGSNRILLPAVAMLAVLLLVCLPLWRAHGRFCARVPHDWAAALAALAADFRPDDAVLLRGGDVKDDWVEPPPAPVVAEYQRAVFATFLWSRHGLLAPAALDTLTYSYRPEFATYYGRLLAGLEGRRRVWVLGVNPPNTNYPVARVPLLVQEHTPLRLVRERDFSGVYLALLALPGEEP